MVEEPYELSKAGIEGVDETQGAGSKKGLVDPGAQKETAADKTEGAAPDETLKEAVKGEPAAEDIVKRTIKRLATKGVKEIADLGDEPDRNPRNTIGDAATLELGAAADSEDHSLKDTSVSRILSKEAGLQDIAAPRRKAQIIRKKNRKGKDF